MRDSVEILLMDFAALQAELAELRERLAIVSGQCDIYHSERDHAVEQLAETRGRLASLVEAIERYGDNPGKTPAEQIAAFTLLAAALELAKDAAAKGGADEKAE